MFWIIAGVVVVAVGILWWWAGKHSKVRGNLRGYRIDQVVGNGDAESTLIRNHTPGGRGSPLG